MGTEDTHTVTIAWDDGTPDSSTSVAAGVGTATLNHTYTAATVATLTVTVTDDDTGEATTAFEFVVIFDPSAGFVTGGGRIDSPAGAYTADPSLSGRAMFGFVAKYKNGATTPDGNTEFQFQAASFNFHSTDYQWLVVSGARAQFKGTGRVNGVDGFGFLLTAIDGKIPGGGGTDKFRIKVVDGADNVVYDNKIGVSDDIDAADPQELAKGSIVIHKK